MWLIIVVVSTPIIDNAPSIEKIGEPVRALGNFLRKILLKLFDKCILKRA